MKPTEEYLKDFGITTTSQHHDYNYLYNSICKVIDIAKKEVYNEAMRWRDPEREFPPIDKIKYPNGNYSADVLGEDFEGNHYIIYYNHDEKDWCFTMEEEDYTIHITKWRPIE